MWAIVKDFMETMMPLLWIAVPIFSFVGCAGRKQMLEQCNCA